MNGYFYLNAFSALTLRLGGRNGIRLVKNSVTGCWQGYLSGVRCTLAYGSADAMATHSLASVKFRQVLTGECISALILL